MPFASVKFGLELAALFLVFILAVLACYWKLSEYLLERKLRSRKS